MVQRDPRRCGAARSRWTLATLLAALDWLAIADPGGLHHLLRRLGISWHRARHPVTSPDPDHEAKLAMVAGAQALARAHPDAVALLYLDAVPIERQPTIAPAWHPVGDSPRAHHSHASNTLTRVVATLDAFTGRVVAQRASHITVPGLVQFFQTLVATYADYERLDVVLDHWPVHFHPDLLVALAPQETCFPRVLPPRWRPEARPTAQRKWGDLALPIQLLPLPTDASWCNPIERLWRKLRQEVVHLHPWANDLAALRQAIDTWLTAYQDGDLGLLRYVGLDA